MQSSTLPEIQTVPVDDHLIIQSVFDGNREAFGELVERYQGMVFGYLYQIVREPELAEDLAQETFLKAYEKLGQYKADSPFRSWLIRIARNNAMTYFRKQKGTEVSLDDESFPSNLLPDMKAINPKESAIAGERLGILEDAIARLSADKRELIVLHYHEEMSLAEIGKLINKSTGAIKVALHRTRLEIREIIETQTQGTLS